MHCTYFKHERTQVGARVGALDDGVLAGIVQDWAFGQRDVRCDASDWYSEEKEQEKYLIYQRKDPKKSKEEAKQKNNNAVKDGRRK